MASYVLQQHSPPLRTGAVLLFAGAGWLLLSATNVAAHLLGSTIPTPSVFLDGYWLGLFTLVFRFGGLTIGRGILMANEDNFARYKHVFFWHIALSSSMFFQLIEVAEPLAQKIEQKLEKRTRLE